MRSNKTAIMKTTRSTRYLFIGVYIVHYFNMAILTSQRLTFLIEVGYSQYQRALIVSLLPATTIVFQLVLGYLSDKFQTVKKFIIGLIVGASLFGFLFYSHTSLLFAYHLLLTLLSSSCISSISELNDVWVFSQEEGGKISYSFMRSFGSLGWSIGCIALSLMVSRYGFESLAYVSLGIACIHLMLVIFLADTTHQASRPSVKITDVFKLFKSKSYVTAMQIMFILNLIANVGGFILVDKILQSGGTQMHIGLRGMIAAGVEVPLFLVGDKVCKKIGMNTMILVATIVYAGQFGLYALANTPEPIIAVTALQFIGVPFYWTGIKTMIMKHSPDGLKASGQMIGPALMNGISAVLAPFVASYLASHYTMDTPLIVSLFLGLIAVGIALLNLKEKGAH